jgi:hypothetical protein
MLPRAIEACGDASTIRVVSARTLFSGLWLGLQEMADARLVRRPRADSLDWLDELAY